MPSQKPRVALTLSPESAAALAELAEAVGKPMATVAAEFLHELVPQFQGLAKIARAAKAGNAAAAKRALAHMVGDAMADVIAEQGDLYATAKSYRKAKAK